LASTNTQAACELTLDDSTASGKLTADEPTALVLTAGENLTVGDLAACWLVG
jgi:hypothetical protein